MPLLPHTFTVIELPVSDRVAGDTTIRQRARFARLFHEQTPEGVSYARISVVVTLYAALGTGTGAALSGPGIGAYVVELLAANDTLVDATTGAILAQRLPGTGDADWALKVATFPQNTMLQGDYFEGLREQPIKIGDLIRQHIANADKLGRFK